MKHGKLIAVGIGAGLCAFAFAAAPHAAGENQLAHGPAVLVELFTSEGCSSCPPADALLESLDRGSAGAEVIVLSEHVDYWNQIGWKDPFSSAQYSERQRGYASRFRLDSVYTPQMVVDGVSQFVGSDARRARSAIQQASKLSKAAIQMDLRSGGNAASMTVQIDVEAVAAHADAPRADVYFAVAQNEADSQVTSGENGGRRLHHVAVVRSLSMVGTITPGAPFHVEVPVNLGNGTPASRFRFVTFVQERGQGRILGSAMKPGAIRP